jgi:hypothetical protein
VCAALVILYAKRTRRIILSYVLCQGLPFFSTLSHKGHDLRKKVIEHKICVLIFSTTFIGNVSHFKNTSLRSYHKRNLFHVKYPIFLSLFK